jgi:antitoxin ParD1/3/4
MPTRNVVLTDHQSGLVDKLVGSGRYQNASEVLREGLRLVEAREAEDAAKLDTLRAAAHTGLAALERGAYEDFADSTALTTHLDKIAAKAIATAKAR